MNVFRAMQSRKTRVGGTKAYNNTNNKSTKVDDKHGKEREEQSDDNTNSDRKRYYSHAWRTVGHDIASNN
jgi:hypothetical protein